MNNKIIICNKKDIILQYDKNINKYFLDFEININNKTVSYLTFQLFNIIQLLNKDLIKKIEIIKKYSEDEMDILLLFEDFMADSGMTNKYLYIKIKLTKTDNLIIFTCKNINNTSNSLNIVNADQINCKASTITFILLDKIIRFNYEFNIDLCEDIPIYMEHFMALIMKKIFYKVKLFLENKK